MVTSSMVLYCNYECTDVSADWTSVIGAYMTDIVCACMLLDLPLDTMTMHDVYNTVL